MARIIRISIKSFIYVLEVRINIHRAMLVYLNTMSYVILNLQNNDITSLVLTGSKLLEGLLCLRFARFVLPRWALGWHLAGTFIGNMHMVHAVPDPSIVDSHLVIKPNHAGVTSTMMIVRSHKFIECDIHIQIIAYLVNRSVAACR